MRKHKGQKKLKIRYMNYECVPVTRCVFETKDRKPWACLPHDSEDSLEGKVLRAVGMWREVVHAENQSVMVSCAHLA